MPVTVVFHEDLIPILIKKYRNNCGVVSFVHARQASIKDVIEAHGVPHTEIGRISAAGADVDFNYLLREDDCLKVFPIIPPLDVLRPTYLRPLALKENRFIVDKNVAKLAPLLRMAGFDTFYEPEISDEAIAEISSQEGRIVLSRDKDLLKRKIVVYGRLVRAEFPEDQFIEVMSFFGLKEKILPFSRCLLCNEFLQPVEKEKILHLLEPLTIKYYDRFQSCSGCGKIYWPGSHRDNMLKTLHKVEN